MAGAGSSRQGPREMWGGEAGTHFLFASTSTAAAHREGKTATVLAVTFEKKRKQTVLFLPPCLYRCIAQPSLNPLLNFRPKKKKKSLLSLWIRKH